MNETGFVQMCCEDGKGRITAAMGVAVRIVGWGHRVLMAKLLRTDDSGEITGFSHVPDITVLPCGRNFGFSWSTAQVQWRAVTPYCNHCLLNTWNIALGAGGGEPYDILVLDEVTSACNLGLMDETGLVKALKGKPATLEVILTGRCPSEVLRDQADYITEMVMRCHPYKHGVGAREGVEY